MIDYTISMGATWFYFLGNILPYLILFYFLNELFFRPVYNFFHRL